MSHWDRDVEAGFRENADLKKQASQNAANRVAQLAAEGLSVREIRERVNKGESFVRAHMPRRRA